MFTTPCFIWKNTPELRKKLEELGFKRNSPDYTLNDSIIFAYQYSAEPGFDTPHYVVANSFDIPFDKESTLRGKFIDCGTNEELFLAIAALRDDSDKDQWFVTENERHWVNQGVYMPAGTFILSLVENYMCADDKVHKATVEELIKHFNHEQDTQAPGNL